MNKVIVIFGPTGVGKTDLSIQLAKKLNGEIISADSMQIYKGMDIGTAKITKEEMQGVSHHMIDIVSPNEEYSVGQYVKEVKQKITEILSRGKIPIICGGTGLYINALVNEYDFNNTEKDEKIREKYQKIAEENGKEFVYELLKKQDPIRASQLHPNDLKRVIRALEIIEINKNKLENNSKMIKNAEKIKKNDKNNEINYEYLIFGLDMPREKLYERINFRVEKMFTEGLIKEVKSLLKLGLDKNCQAMQGIGYKEIINGLENNQSEEQIKELIKQRTRNYAKRQLTFMRGIKKLIWIKAGENTKNEILKRIKMEDELILIKPNNKWEKQVMEFKQEFFDANSKLHGSSGLEKFDNYKDWLNKVISYQNKEIIPNKDHVQATTFLAVRKNDKKLVGMVNIRHYLNDGLLLTGGHIGDSVRPSERRKGYATQIIRLALNECKKLGINKVLITCDKDNIGSAKSIQKNGGVLENEINDNGNLLQRYWINLEK